MKHYLKVTRVLPFVALASVSACSGNLDFDMRDQFGGLFDTSSAARSAVANLPAPDARGVITFPTYQVILAKNGDRISDVATRINADAGTLGRYNGISQEAILRHGEIVALPSSIVATGATGAPLAPTVVDISELSDTPVSPSQLTGVEPIRHRVLEGETAFTIARLYNVTADDLAEWNSLGPEKEVRTGQYLLIPVTKTSTQPISAPGEGSITPVPPSSIRPQPRTDLQPGQLTTAPTTSPIADTGATTQASSIDSRFVRPASGNIIRSYRKGDNEGIDIGTAAGAPVVAADDGTVAAVTKDTNGVPIVVIKHMDGLLTVYTNVDGLAVKKGDRVTRGQKIAKVRAGTPSFLHFEVRKGLESVDPDSYI